MKGEDEPTDLPIPSRPYRSIVKEFEPRSVIAESHAYYTNFDDLLKRLKSLKIMSTWNAEVQEGENVTISFQDPQFTLPKFEITIVTSLAYTIRVYRFLLPEDHEMYKLYKRSVRNITVSNIVALILQNIICSGVDNKSFSGKLIHHSVPFDLDPSKDDYQQSDECAVLPFRSVVYCRSTGCTVLGSVKKCSSCEMYDKSVRSANKVSDAKLLQPCKLKAPISVTAPERVKLTLQNTRLRCTQLENEVEHMRSEIKKSSVQVDSQLTNDFIDIMGNQTNATPFMNMFWQEQQKLFQRSSKGARFHPEIIRFCLSLFIKSPVVYEEIRNSGILRLPSKRTLRDYKNFIRPKTGFSRPVLNELIKLTENYSGSQRFVVIVFDEMKVKSNLVFDKYTGELIGFLDLGDPDINFATLDEEDELATHALVFFLRGLCSDLKFSLAYFSTNNVTALQVFGLYWEAVCLLETVCQLNVLATTCDGASSNRRFFKMCALLDPVNTRNLTYRALNIYAPNRYIFFFSDPPHLIKTARNCLSNSAPGVGKRYLWNNDKYLLWQQISSLYFTDMENGGKTATKLTVAHIKLNAYSRMTVRFAAQVLSETVATNLELFSEDATETAKFCRYFDQFFDCMNVRSSKEASRKRKPFLELYKSKDDPRLKWMIKDFLGYLSEWKKNVDERPGDFSKNERARMFLSQPTYEGVQITVYSTAELVPYLLENGAKYVQTEKTSQDDLEEHFGDHRQTGGRCDNPDIYRFGYNENALRAQGQVLCTSGNTSGRYANKRVWDKVSDVPVPKRKQTKSSDDTFHEN